MLYLFLSLAFSQPPALSRLPNPNDAVAMALADARTLRPEDRLFTRYVWVRSGNDLDGKVASFVLNMLSRGSQIVRPLGIGTGKMLVLRCDLRAYAPQINDLNEWTKLWEQLQFDPAFSLLITRGILKQLAPDAIKGKGFVVGDAQVFVETEPYIENGETYHGRWEKKRVDGLRDIVLKDLQDVDLIRVPGQFLDRSQWDGLSQLLNTASPIVSDGYFIGRTASTIRDKGLFSVVYGGLYYELGGIRRNAQKGTDEDNLLEQLGVGNVAKGITAKEIFSKLRSDQRVAIFRSQVTGSPRQMEFFRTLSGRLDLASGLISFTHDLKNQNVDIDTHPIANLLAFRDDAREVIAEKSNGLHLYAAFNGQGALQDEVPFDVASDHTIPAPHTRRLQPAISCISCHEADGSDGWKKAENDVMRLIQRKGKLDIFGDTSQAANTVPDTLDRLAGLYQGDPERALSRGRDDYAAAVLKATGTWPSQKGQADAVKLAAERTVGLWRSYYYGLVTPARALQELGIEVGPGADATKILNELLEPDLRATVTVPEIGTKIVAEDPRLAALKNGIAISRFDWDLSQSFAADRVRQKLSKLSKTKPVKQGTTK